MKSPMSVTARVVVDRDVLEAMRDGSRAARERAADHPAVRGAAAKPDGLAWGPSGALYYEGEEAAEAHRVRDVVTMWWAGRRAECPTGQVPVVELARAIQRACVVEFQAFGPESAVAFATRLWWVDPATAELRSRDDGQTSYSARPHGRPELLPRVTHLRDGFGGYSADND